MLILRNSMEELVNNILADIIEDLDVCKCERCIMDISAIALNNLPPKYSVTDKGELYTKVNILRMQVEVDVITALTKAAKLVKDKPNH